MFSTIASICIWVALITLLAYGVYRLVLSIKDKKKKRKEKGE